MTPARRRILAVLTLVAGCRSATPTPTANATPIVALDSTQWRADLHFLATELERRHLKAFFHVSRDAFYKETAAIDADIPRLSAPEIVFRFKRLVALIGDGHTIGPSIVPDERRLPFRVQWFADGFGVVGAASGYKDLSGARLVAVGDFAVDAAFDTVRHYDGSDNMWGARLWAERHLSSATALAAMHLVREGAPVRVTFIADSGRREISFPWPTGPVARTAPIDPPSVTPAARLLPFGWRYDTTAHAVIVHYDRCDKILEFRAMADTILRFVDSVKPMKLVVDVRTNPGGDNQIALPFIHGLASRSKTLPRGSIYVLMGRGTFSSGMDFAIDMRNIAHALLAGEPTGGTPNGYGEVKQLQLPNSHLTWQYSTKYFGLDKTGANTVSPDLEISPTIKDIIAKRDVVLETALRR